MQKSESNISLTLVINSDRKYSNHISFNLDKHLKWMDVNLYISPNDIESFQQYVQYIQTILSALNLSVKELLIKNIPKQFKEILAKSFNFSPTTKVDRPDNVSEHKLTVTIPQDLNEDNEDTQELLSQPPQNSPISQDESEYDPTHGNIDELLKLMNGENKSQTKQITRSMNTRQSSANRVESKGLDIKKFKKVRLGIPALITGDTKKMLEIMKKSGRDKWPNFLDETKRRSCLNYIKNNLNNKNTTVIEHIYKEISEFLEKNPEFGID